MSQQRRVFLKTWWSPYLGEWRPFHDNYIYAYNTGCTFSGSAVFTLVAPTPSVTPTLTMTPTPSVTTTPSITPSLTPTETPQITPSVTPTITNTPSITASETPTLTPSVTPTTTTTLTATPTSTPEATTTNTPTLTNSPTPSVTQTQTASSTPTLTPTTTTTLTSTPNLTPSPTNTITPTSTQPTFEPSSLGNLQYWFKSTEGASSSSWTNYGLIGGALTQSVGVNQPTIISNDTFGSSYTGQSVNFGALDFMTLSHPSSATTFTGKTFFFVSQVNSRSDGGWSINIQNGSGYTLNNNIWDYQFYGGVNTTISRSKPGRREFLFTTGYTLYAASGLTTTGFTASVNDTLGTSGTTSYIGEVADWINFGYSISGTPFTNNISMFEFLGYNRLLTQSEFNQVLNYLKTKYNYSTPPVTPSMTPTRTPAATPTLTPSPTSTIPVTPSVTPTRTSPSYLYYNVEAYDKSSCALVTTGVLKIETSASLTIGFHYCNSASTYKYKLLSLTSGPSSNFQMNVPWVGQASCGGLTCI